MAELAIHIVGRGWESVADDVSANLGVEHRSAPEADVVIWDFPNIAEPHAELLLHDAVRRADPAAESLAVKPTA